MPDYSSGKIYAIYTSDNNEKPLYIGSTTQSLSSRLAQHKQFAKQPNSKQTPLVKYIKENSDESLYIELISDFPCETKEQLLQREGYYIREYDTFKNGLNGVVAGRTTKEYEEERKESRKPERAERYANNREEEIKKVQKWRDENREQYLETQRAYREKNRKMLNEKSKKYKEDHRDTVLEKQKQYRYENPDKVRAIYAKHHAKNKEKRNAYSAQYREKNDIKVQCECGGQFIKRMVTRHNKSQMHINYLKSLNEEVKTEDIPELDALSDLRI